MTAEDELYAEVAGELAGAAGGYLRNVIREPHVTCSVCGTPVQPEYSHCYVCNQHRSTAGIADLVVPLTYSIEGQQSYQVFRGYKDHPTAAVRAKHTWIIERLLFLGFVHHKRCIDRRVGAKVDRYLGIPSLSGRNGPHPFMQRTNELGLTHESPRLIAAPGATSARILSADQFALVPQDLDLSGRHVLIFDDTWTQGSRTQSAALQLRRHGAKHVSVMVMSRYLRPSYGNNAEFIRTRLGRDYDPTICPVTGGDCP